MNVSVEPLDWFCTVNTVAILDRNVKHISEEISKNENTRKKLKIILLTFEKHNTN